MTSVWQVRAGRAGELGEAALRDGVVILGWSRMPDLAEFGSRDELRLRLLGAYGDRSPASIGNWTGQLWRFSREMSVGDLVVMPVRTRSTHAVGEVRGPYRYRVEEEPGLRHTRAVRWLRTDVDRAEFDLDLRRSMSSRLTVCRLSRPDAPARIARIAGV